MSRAPNPATFAIIVVLALFASAIRPAEASDRLMTGLGEAQVLYRTATIALRAGKPEDAQAPLKRLVDVWSTALAAVRSGSSGGPRIAMLPEMMEGSAQRLKRAAEAAEQNRADQALEELAPLKREWITMRRSAGLYGIVECLDEASEALDAFQAIRRTTPDLNRPETRGEVIARTAVYRFALKRCDAFSALDIGIDADYRRQSDSIAAALDVVDSALRLRDSALLERVLTDLKTFDTQLSQRYGG